MIETVGTGEGADKVGLLIKAPRRRNHLELDKFVLLKPFPFVVFGLYDFGPGAVDLAG